MFTFVTQGAGEQKQDPAAGDPGGGTWQGHGEGVLQEELQVLVCSCPGKVVYTIPK